MRFGVFRSRNMTTYFLSQQQLSDFLTVRQGKEYYGPIRPAGHDRPLAKVDLQGRYTRVKSEPLPWVGKVEDQVWVEGLRRPRACQSVKGVFMPPMESVAHYGGEQQDASIKADSAVVVGVRACELKALKYLDRVMLEGEHTDPFYKARREAITVVSCDCHACADTCCCTLVGGRPYCTEGYDINVTPLDDGYVVDVATEKGEALLDGKDYPQASEQHLSARQEARNRMTEQVQNRNQQFTFQASDEAPQKMPEGDDMGWQKFAADCVECGACTNVCPTCYCFYLYDQQIDPKQFERVRSWDSCLLSTYPRMAGGVNMKLNPRAELRSRLANRILHKFVYSPQQVGLVSCVGCGRCITGCAGAIDIRQVVQELSK